MLIRTDEGSLIIVRQTDHMAQVARIAEHWGNDNFPEPELREETIRAAGLHDNGWRDWEEQPTLVPETGRPRNLTEVGGAVHDDFYRAGVERAVAIDPYTGLLVSLHAVALAVGVEGWDLESLCPPEREDLGAEKRAWVREQTAWQQRLRTSLATSPRYGPSISPSRLWSAYLRLRAWDRLSLYFVYFGLGDGQIDHVPSSDGETTIALRQTGLRRASLAPWPFDRDDVAFPVVATRVPDRRYQSSDDFVETLIAAPVEVQVFTACRRAL